MDQLGRLFHLGADPAIGAGVDRVGCGIDANDVVIDSRDLQAAGIRTVERARGEQVDHTKR